MAGAIWISIPLAFMFVLFELSYRASCSICVSLLMLGVWGWCVYIGCHSGKCGDGNVLMTEEVQVQPTKEETVSGCWNLQSKQRNYLIDISTFANQQPCF